MTPVIPSDVIAVNAVFNEMVEPATVILAPATRAAAAADHVYADPLYFKYVSHPGAATGNVSV